MNPSLINHIKTILSESIKSIKPLSGGDISSAYKLSTSSNDFFLKINTNNNALSMLKAEAFGLNTIAKTNTIAVPKVISCDIYENNAFLILEFIESKSPNDKDFENLGKQLAQLHKTSSNNFGLDQHNFIGSLNQYNTKHENWQSFYYQERLLPQFKIAMAKGLLIKNQIPNPNQINDILNKLFQNIKPSLIHGDLWSGNYLISKEGIPYVIDPAIYYGHNEVDIAMTNLFGGFSHTFYEAYFKVFPKREYFNERQDIYQLYYLLVHLNLFGASYLKPVNRLLNKYF